MPGGPADRSLFSRMVQGSKFFSPRRRLLRTTGSSVTVSPLGSSIVVGFLIVRVDRADAHVQPRHVEDALQLRHVAR